VVLGWNNVISMNAEYTTSQLVFGSEIRLPSDLLVKSNLSLESFKDEEVRRFMKEMSRLRAILISHYGKLPAIFKSDDLERCSMVWIRNDARKGCDAAFVGSYKVIQRYTDYFLVQISLSETKKVNVSRLVPAYGLS
jgi:hypothetical protein